LPHGGKAMLSDTVGFISNLPTQLVAAFRATLEEVMEADVILHVRDISHEDAEAQQHDVEAVLRQLGIDPGQGARILEVWNKIDRFDADQRENLENIAARRSAARALSRGRAGRLYQCREIDAVQPADARGRPGRRHAVRDPRSDTTRADAAARR
jgi:50S ribosomal subunit-associated GTPase HflX